MVAAFHYIVRVKLIRFINNGVIDFISDEKIFKENKPILAREKAISYYNSYIDTILEPDLSHNEIKLRLSKRIKKQTVEIDDESVEMNDMFNGIGVFLKIDRPMDDDKVGDEFYIHGVGFSFSGAQSIIDNLNFENYYYDHYGYDTKNYRTTVKFYEADLDKVNDEVILKTPFDWTGYDIPIESEEFIEEETTEDITIPERKELFSELIGRGETNRIEFKSSLVSFKNAMDEVGYSKHIKFKIAKAIASFLNSNGGCLFVGVKDDKSILGLESDFSLAQSKINNPIDYFRIEVDKILKEHFKSVANNITGEFIEYGDKLIYAFTIQRSQKPIFITNRTDKDVINHKKEFYVRLTGASSVLYAEIDEIVDYCLNNWCKKE